MSLTTAIDAALAKAEAEGARPFRIHLRAAEIETLRSTGALEPYDGKVQATGSYKGLNVFEMESCSELLAQPEDQFPALAIAIAS